MSTSHRPSVLRTWLPRVVLVAAGFLLAFLVLDRTDRPEPTSDSARADATEVWTCAMHPQIRLPESGKCPVCFMDLIPETTDSDDGPTRLSMSDASMNLAEIVTAPVRRQLVEAEVRTSGKVAVDERSLKRITAWTEGRLDRLYVDYTGITVRKGDHLVDIYSPELYSAQTELIESIRARDRLQSSTVGYLRSSAEATVTAAREKLRLLGFTRQQIRTVEETEQASERVTLYAPMAGIVVHKAAVEGEYVKTGSPIYTIADLSHVWVLLDLYESDLVWIRFGQKVAFTVEAFPGEIFDGRIAFIDPVVNPRTRTVTVRVNAENPNLRLKPDMFVRAVIRSTLVGDGRTLDPDLAGKWISPMHPEVVKDRPGSCDVCGMALVRAEELGFTGDPGTQHTPLVIPASAPLITGKRSVVYVRVPGAAKPTFEGREVTLGARAGGFYVVEAGLTEGEDVVVNGAFKIDSAMQIQAKPSMMNPQGGAPPPGHSHESSTPSGQRVPEDRSNHEGHDHGPGSELDPLAVAPVSFRASLEPVYGAYFAFQEALAADDPAAARTALRTLVKRLNGVNATDLGAQADAGWKSVRARLATATEGTGPDSGLDDLRRTLDGVSGAVIDLARSAGPPPGSTHHVFFCPMAFENRGARWLQTDTQVNNPYFGASMLRCGEVLESMGEGVGQ